MAAGGRFTAETRARRLRLMGWGLRDEHVLMGEFHIGLQRCKPGPAVAVVLERQPGLLRAWPPLLPGGPAAPQDTQGSPKWPWPHPASCPSAGAGLRARPQLPAPARPPTRAPASSQARRPPRLLSRGPEDGRLFAVAVTVLPPSCVRSPAPVLIYNTASAPRRVFLKGIISINFN